MPVNSDYAYSFGGDDSAVWVGDKDAANLPTDLTKDLTPNGLVDVGWISDDGISFDDKMSINKAKGHQGGKVVKVLATDREFSFKFSMLETTAVVMGISFPGTELTNANGVVSGTIKGGAVYDSRAWVIDEYSSDGKYLKRYVIKSGAIDPSKTLTYKADDLMTYDCTVNVEGDVELITNLPGMVKTVEAAAAAGVTTPVAPVTGA